MFGAIGKQFRRPNGFFGKIIAHVMKKGNTISYDIMLKYLDINHNEHLFEIGYGHGLGIKKYYRNMTALYLVLLFRN